MKHYEGKWGFGEYGSRGEHPRKRRRKKIGPVEKGALHRELGIAQGKKIGRDRLEAAKAQGKRTGNAKEVRRATFALNMNKGRG